MLHAFFFSKYYDIKYKQNHDLKMIKLAQEMRQSRIVMDINRKMNVISTQSRVHTQTYTHQYNYI